VIRPGVEIPDNFDGGSFVRITPSFLEVESIFSQNANATGLHTASYVSRKGEAYFFNRAAGKVWAVTEDPISSTVSLTHVMGGGVGATCEDGMSTSSPECTSEILDIATSGDLMFFWDLSRIRSINMAEADINNRTVETIYGRSSFHGDGLLASSARFSWVSRFGSYGRDSEGKPDKKNLMVLDVFTRRFRSVQNGKTDTFFGTGHYGYIRDSVVQGVNGASETKLYFDWGSEVARQRKSFQVDADGNVYLISRSRREFNRDNVWDFLTLKINQDKFYDGVSVRKYEPITHFWDEVSADADTYITDREVGDT